MELNDILKIAVKASASDIHLKAGLQPIFRIDGSLVPLSNSPTITTEQVVKIMNTMLNAQQKLRFEEFNEVDLAYGVAGVGRFRVNAFQQRGTPGLVFRVIPYVVKSIDQLELPPILKTIALEERGLILVTGATGSGKSTTLAAMVDYINENHACNIVTIEEPIEYLVKDKKSIVNQREVGVDTVGFNLALRGALRQDPDVILVGEMRDAETMETAIQAAETGHLVLSTLHTSDAVETINRIVSVFPPYQHKQIRLQLASNLKAVISQRLVNRQSGEGRVPAVEILINNSRTKEMIENPDRTREMHQAIAESHVSYNMQTFDQSLMQLLSKELISYEEALKQSSNPHDFALRASGIHSGTDANWDAFERSAEAESALIPNAQEPERAQKK
jgi:twitching motility protein PilT